MRDCLLRNARKINEQKLMNALSCTSLEASEMDLTCTTNWKNGERIRTKDIVCLCFLLRFYE